MLPGIDSRVFIEVSNQQSHGKVMRLSPDFGSYEGTGAHVR